MTTDLIASKKKLKSFYYHQQRTLCGLTTRHRMSSKKSDQPVCPATVVRLFGSRVVVTLRGGDIDLLIEPAQTIKNRIQEECRLSASLNIKLGGRKVDVLILNPLSQPLPIHAQAMHTGIIL